MVLLEVQFDLAYEVEDAQGADFIFNIHAAQTDQQAVLDESVQINQAVTPALDTDPATANRFMRLHAPPGELKVSYRAKVKIRHHLAEPDTLAEVPVRSLPLAALPYVVPSRYCQSDRLMRLAANEFGALWPGYSRVLAIQHWVQKHVTFTSNSSTATTSAIDTVIEQVGVCRDFTHLMIALCRALNIPARIATGMDYGANPNLGPPDFHAYVEVFLGDRWYLFDASGTTVPMGLLRIGTGRDAADVAFATIFGKVTPFAPFIRVHAQEGAGLELPRHRREALSTSAAVMTSTQGSQDANATEARPIARARREGDRLNQLPD